MLSAEFGAYFMAPKNNMHTDASYRYGYFSNNMIKICAHIKQLLLHFIYFPFIWFELMNLLMFDNLFFCVWTRFQVGWFPTGIFGWTILLRSLHSFLHFVAIGRQQRWLRRIVEQKRPTNHRCCCCCEGNSATIRLDGKVGEWGRGQRELGLGEVARQPRRSGETFYHTESS